MTDTEARVTSTDIKDALRPVRQVVERLPSGEHQEKAREAIDTLRDHALKAVEGV